MRRMGCAALTLGLVAGLSGCGVTRDGALRPSVNDCAAALPVAQRLLGSQARLLHVRRLALASVQDILRSDAAPTLAPSPRATVPASAGATAPATATSTAIGVGTAAPRPCVLSFAGDYQAADLRPAATASGIGVSGASAGSVAVVVTTTRHPRVLRLVLTRRDPLG